ncbi:MAG: hypothetical protein U1E76_13430 [Planctomycetota bacterium]
MSWRVRAGVSCCFVFATLVLENAVGQQPMITLGQGFDGPTQVAGCVPNDPPDPNIAVGATVGPTPAYVVTTVNSHIYTYLKSTGALQTTQSLEGAFGLFGNAIQPNGSPGSGGANACPVGDPHCIYDHYENRFVITAITLQGYIWFGVSQSSDPTLPWYTYETTQPPFIDYPGLGYDRENYYVTERTNLPPNPGALLRIFKKTDVLNWQATTLTDVNITSGFFVQPAVSWDTPVAGYFLDAIGTNTLRVYGWYQLLLRSADIHLFPGWTVPQNPESCGIELAAIPSLDNGRIINAVYRNDRLYGAHSVTNTSQNKTQVQWFEIQLNGWPAGGSPQLIASNTFDASHPPVASGQSFLPAIAQNGDGKLGIVVSTADVGVPPGVAIAGRNAAGLWNSTLINVKTGICKDLDPGYRWGDFNGVSVDPDNDTTFWVIGEYWRQQGLYRLWGNWIQSFRVN